MDVSFHSNGWENLGETAPGCNPFLERWEKVFSAHPERGAVLDPEGRVVRTFGEIARRAESLRNSLRKRGNPRPVVAIAAGGGADWAEALLGVWQSGGIAIPWEGPPALQGLSRGDFPPCDFWYSDGELLPGGGGAEADAEMSAGVDLFKVTSGTTARRRLVGFSGRALLADAGHVARGMGIGPEDRNLAVIPLAHSYGLTNLLGCLLGIGSPIVLTAGVLPRAIAAAAEAGKATVLPAVPALIRAIGVLDRLPASVRLVISAGALLPSGLAREFSVRFARKVHAFYGATECGGICYDATGDCEVPEGFVGEALPGVYLEEQEVDGGLALRVGGEAVGLGYLPPGGDDRLAGGQFAAPDLVSRWGSGYRIVGRVEDFINVGGRKVNPAEIERCLLGLEGIGEAVAFAAPDPSGRGEMVAVCYVGTALEEKLAGLAAAHLLPWQVPRAWFRVECLPISSRGKISRRALKERFFGPAG